MAFRKVLGVLGINGVSAGATATVNINPGKRIHSLDLFPTDGGAADYTKVEEITLSVGGTEMQRMTAAEIIALYEENLNSANAGHLPINFSELSRATVLDQEITAWDTQGEGNIEMKVKFAAGATNPTLKIMQTVDEAQYTDSKTGMAIKRPIKRLPLNYNPGAGWFELTNLPSDTPITAIRINTTSTPTLGDISEFEVYRGSEKVMEGTYLENQKILEAMGFDATKFILPIIFGRDHRVENALDPRVFNAKGQQTGTLPITVRIKMASAKPIKVLVDQVRQSFN